MTLPHEVASVVFRESGIGNKRKHRNANLSEIVVVIAVLAHNRFENPFGVFVAANASVRVLDVFGTQFRLWDGKRADAQFPLAISSK